MIVNNIIKDAVESITGTYYLRATDAEANIEVDYIDLDGLTVCIYNNLPTVNNSVSIGGIVREWPIEVKILQLADMDDNDEDGDLIRNECTIIADALQNLITSDIRVSQAADIEDYQIEMLDNVKLYDKTLTGVTLSFDLNLPNNICHGG